MKIVEIKDEDALRISKHPQFERVLIPRELQNDDLKLLVYLKDGRVLTVPVKLFEMHLDFPFNFRHDRFTIYWDKDDLHLHVNQLLGLDF